MNHSFYSFFWVNSLENIFLNGTEKNKYFYNTSGVEKWELSVGT